MDNVKAQESWNMATETLKRLSRCLNMCSFFSQQGDLISWLNASMDLRRNLHPFLEPTEIKAINDKLNEMPKQWKSSEGKIMRGEYAKVYKVLDDVYILFIGYMKEKGLLMPKMTDPRSAVINN